MVMSAVKACILAFDERFELQGVYSTQKQLIRAEPLMVLSIQFKLCNIMFLQRYLVT